MSDPVKPAAPSETAAAARTPRRLWRTLWLVSGAAGHFLAGLVLLLYPWSEWWAENYFAARVPAWESGYLRGAISGLGAVCLALSLLSMVQIRRR